MTIYASPDFSLSYKLLIKSKYSKTYGSLPDEIKKFFKEYSTFDQVWTKNYMLYENSDIRINKIRLENPLQNAGKSGGFRVIVLCDKRDRSINLLYVYPKTGPHGKDSLLNDFQKKLVKDFSKAKKDNKLIQFDQ